MLRNKLAFALTAASLVLAASPVCAREVLEPRKITSAAKLKSGEGALRLSTRLQVQMIDTLFVYFIEVLPDDSDGERLLRFERGAGVPLMGSNMIDTKPLIYKVPAGRYRPLAFTVACTGLPFEGAACSKSMGNVPLATLPTGYYKRSEPMVTVAAGQMTEGGDFIVEYDTGISSDAQANEARKNPGGYSLRWRPLPPGQESGFTGITRGPRVSAGSAFTSKITCERRPANVSLYSPTTC